MEWSVYWQEMNKGSDFHTCLEAAKEDFNLKPDFAFAAVFEEASARIEKYEQKQKLNQIKEAALLWQAAEEGTET